MAMAERQNGHPDQAPRARGCLARGSSCSTIVSQGMNRPSRIAEDFFVDPDGRVEKQAVVVNREVQA